MTNSVRGVVRGRTIELTDDPGVADGQGVEVTIRLLTRTDPRIEAIHRTAGSMATDPEFGPITDEIERQRRSASYRDPAR